MKYLELHRTKKTAYQNQLAKVALRGNIALDTFIWKTSKIENIVSKSSKLELEKRINTKK